MSIALTGPRPQPRHRPHAPGLDAAPLSRLAFDEELLRHAEQTSAYSVVEREQPDVVASVTRDWSNPKVIGYLRELLVSRPGDRRRRSA